MAEDKKRLSILSRTGQPERRDIDPDTIEIPASGRTLPISVGMKETELAILDEEAGKLGIARNGFMRFLLRWALKRYLAGQLDLASSIEEPPPPKRRLKFD